MSERNDRVRLVFGSEAELYDRVRPSYPPEAVRWLVGEQPLRVVDLAAGTGIFTRLVRSAGHEVVAVEPDAAMRAVLEARTGDIEVVAGQAESIPLPDASVDAVIAAQAHWWFDGARAFPEIARVLRPGGVFGAVWNGPDGRVPWAAELNRIEGGGLKLRIKPPRLGAEFGPLAQAEFEHRVTHTAETLLDLICSRGYFIAAPPERQRELEREVRRLASDLPAEFELPYVAYACRASII